jgi:hypothetical protein
LNSTFGFRLVTAPSYLLKTLIGVFVAQGVTATTLGTISLNPEMPKMTNNDDMDLENTIMEYNFNDVFGDLK